MAESVCPICDGTGYTVVERNGLSGAKRCSCAAVARPAALRHAANIPPNYEDVSFATFQVTPYSQLAKVLLDVKTYARQFPVQLLPLASHESPADYIVGRVCLLFSEL